MPIASFPLSCANVTVSFTATFRAGTSPSPQGDAETWGYPLILGLCVLIRMVNQGIHESYLTSLQGGNYKNRVSVRAKMCGSGVAKK